MKLAIISDLHIGRTQYRTDENNYNKYEQIGYRVLKENVQVIKSKKPDLIINAGDIFDKPNPSVLAMTNYFSAMNELKDIPTMTIIGNHDFAFNNRSNHCSAVQMANHTYFADYEIKTVEIEDILFVMMPYIYDTKSNIEKYLESCINIASNSKNKTKILVTHGVTEKYYKDSFISDPIMLSDELVELFDIVIIGHIHTPFTYKQNKTLVISPGAMIDYQAYGDRTGPIFLNTDTKEYEKIKIKTPHIIKVSCDESNINDILKNVTEDIYHIKFNGDVSIIDNDLFIDAKNKSVNLIIDIIQPEEEQENIGKKLELNIYDWINTNYPDYNNVFLQAKEAITA